MSASPRRIFLILSPRSLSYSALSFRSLIANAVEDLELYLITDTAEDKEELARALELDSLPERHRAKLYCKEDLADREADRFARYPNIRQFRYGHPCWRKVTDPLLLTEDGEEMVMIDPDLYFPNPFAFEPTPDRGIRLMWQQPTCFVRPDQISLAMDKGIRLADHVDIGVGHWRAPVDLDWLNWLLGQLDFPALKRYMHFEAFVWAALAMHLGGGYLDPEYWHCWQFTIPRKVGFKIDASKSYLIGTSNFPKLKCFHAGGVVKYWLIEAEAAGLLHTPQLAHTLPGRVSPFEELKPSAYNRDIKAKELLGRLGYYKLFSRYGS